MLEGRQPVPALLDFAAVRMADPDGVQDQRQGIGEVDRVQRRVAQPFSRRRRRPQKRAVRHIECILCMLWVTRKREEYVKEILIRLNIVAGRSGSPAASMLTTTF